MVTSSIISRGKLFGVSDSTIFLNGVKPFFKHSFVYMMKHFFSTLYSLTRQCGIIHSGTLPDKSKTEFFYLYLQVFRKDQIRK